MCSTSAVGVAICRWLWSTFLVDMLLSIVLLLACSADAVVLSACSAGSVVVAAFSAGVVMCSTCSVEL